jgi:SAM-dependent methyltransferase
MLASSPTTTLPSDICDAIGLVVERLEAAWLPAVLFGDPDMHAYEALRIDQFARMLAIAREHAIGRRYLEVGSGIGTKLVLAKAAGFEVTGIEAREQYAAVSRYIAPEAVTVVADARGYLYREWDVVYSYRPLISNAAEEALEQWISSQLPAGAVWIHPFRSLLELGWSEIVLDSWVWRRP